LPALGVCRDYGKVMEDRIPPERTKAETVGEYAPNNSGFGDKFQRERRPKPFGSAEKP